MAFTGVPVVQKVTDSCWRITGVSLAADASGTIQFDDAPIHSGPVIGPEPSWQPYELEGVVSLQDMVQVMINVVTDVGVAVPLSVVKTGTTHADFLITIHNDNAALGDASGDLEIYVMKAN